MARIPYRGKDHNIVSVGPSKAYDFTTVQGALDDIENSPPNGAPSSTNPYLVTVAPGVYAENVTMTSAHNYVSLRGESKFGSIVRPATGDALTIGDATTPAQYISVENINLASADSFGVRFNATADEPDADAEWDDIDISNCVLDGYQAGVKVNGTTDASTDDPPRLRLAWNLVRSSGRRGMFVDGNTRLSTLSNVFRVNDAGDSTWLATLVGSAGIKISASIVGDSGSPDALTYWYSTSDVFETIATQDVGGLAGARRCCGIGLLTNVFGRIVLTGPRIYVEYSDTGGTVTSDRFAGVACDVAVAEDDFILAGGSIECRQLTGASAAPDIYGIGSTGTTSFLKAYGTSIVIVDDVATSTLASLWADSGCTIEAKVFSDTATGGTGTLTAIAEKP